MGLESRLFARMRPLGCCGLSLRDGSHSGAPSDFRCVGLDEQLIRSCGWLSVCGLGSFSDLYLPSCLSSDSSGADSKSCSWY